jgi:hypothetical protein
LTNTDTCVAITSAQAVNNAFSYYGVYTTGTLSSVAAQTCNSGYYLTPAGACTAIAGSSFAIANCVGYAIKHDMTPGNPDFVSGCSQCTCGYVVEANGQCTATTDATLIAACSSSSAATKASTTNGFFMVASYAMMIVLMVVSLI